MNNQEKLFVVKEAINIMPAFRNFKPRPFVGLAQNSPKPRLGSLQHKLMQEIQKKLIHKQKLQSKLPKDTSNWGKDDFDFFYNA